MANSNFSCYNPDLSESFVTDQAWRLIPGSQHHTNTTIAVGIAQILFIVIGAPWNLIVLLSILKSRLYKEPTYVLLINLVVVDLLVCVCVLPFNAQSALAKEFTIGNSDLARCNACYAILISILILVYISLFTLALMSVDRLIYIRWPLKYPMVMSFKFVLASLVIVWCICVLVCILPAFGIGHIGFSNNVGSCSLQLSGKTRITNNINFVMVLVLVAIFPFMTTVVSNIWLLYLVCATIRARHTKKMERMSQRNISRLDQRNSEQSMKVTYYKQQVILAQVFGALFAANIITWIPTVFISLASAIVGGENVPRPLFAFVYLAYVSQPVIHPMLETCLLGRARAVIVKCLCCSCRKKRTSWTSSRTSLTQ